MNHMLRYLTEHPDKGLLGYESMGFANIQYWRQGLLILAPMMKTTKSPSISAVQRPRLISGMATPI